MSVAHGGGHAHSVGRDVVRHVLHHVVDGQPGADRAAGRVDVQADVALVILGGEQHDLGADPVGDVVVHLLAEKDDPVPEQPLEERVAQGHHRRLRGARDDARHLMEQRGAAHDRLLVRLLALRRVTHGALLA
jgi:hypothetical protein